MKRTDEDIADGRFPCLLVGEEILVRLEASEPNRHLWYDTRKDGTKTLVKRQWCLSLNDLGSCSNEPSWFSL